MRGQEPLLQMRRSGVLPSATAWVTDTECELDAWLSRNWHGAPNTATGHLEPCIHLDERDVPELLDFRCLIGLQVHLHCWRGDERAKRLFAAIRNAGPAALACARDNEIWFFTKEQGGNGKRLRT